jgi:hypothetical protein
VQLAYADFMMYPVMEPSMATNTSAVILRLILNSPGKNVEHELSLAAHATGLAIRRMDPNRYKEPRPERTADGRMKYPG